MIADPFYKQISNTSPHNACEMSAERLGQTSWSVFFLARYLGVGAQTAHAILVRELTNLSLQGPGIYLLRMHDCTQNLERQFWSSWSHGWYQPTPYSRRLATFFVRTCPKILPDNSRPFLGHHTLNPLPGKGASVPGAAGNLGWRGGGGGGEDQGIVGPPSTPLPLARPRKNSARGRGVEGGVISSQYQTRPYPYPFPSLALTKGPKGRCFGWERGGVGAGGTHHNIIIRLRLLRGQAGSV